MNRLAPIGILVSLLAGCPSSHDIVRSCSEAASAPDGTACEGFTSCPIGGCADSLACTGGVVRRAILVCDGGPGDSGSLGHDASVDAGVDGGPMDAGPCAPPPPTTGGRGCHTSSDCDPSRFEMCFAPGASRGCGPCVMAVRTCATDADCAASDFCESYVDPCSVPGFCGNGSDVTSTRCTPRCTASSCPAGSTCGTDGRCAAIPCTAGFTCPPHTTCGASGADAHGCGRDSCAFDADCGCGGACLGGFCYDTLGECASPAA